MKKEFIAPQITISKFSFENIITASGITLAKEALGDAGVTSPNAVTTVDVLVAFNK